MNYKGYEINSVVSGVCTVYRNNKIVTVEPNSSIAILAIDNRIYSNPSFNETRYQQNQDNLQKLKIKNGDGKKKSFVGPKKNLASSYITDEQIQVEIIKRSKND